MPGQDTTVDSGIVGRVRAWLAARAEASRLREELAALPPSERARIARDAGLGTTKQLADLVDRGTHAADEMGEMATLLGFDLDQLKAEHPALVRQMQVTCSRCGDKGRCHAELADGSAAKDYRAFCPNAPEFDALRVG